MKKFITILLLALATFAVVPALAQSKPKMAVYVASDELKDTEKRVLGTKILAPFVQSGQYMAIERGDAFLSGIARERQKQRDGSVDDSQISRLGKEAGVQFVCVADLIDAFGVYSLSARLINTETAEIVGIGETEMKSLSDIGTVADEIFKQITTGKKSQAKSVVTKETNIQNLETLKQTKVWMEINAKFPNSEAFFDAAKMGFINDLKKWNPQTELKNNESLVMTAMYGKHGKVTYTFFIDMNSSYVAVIETKYYDKPLVEQKFLRNVVSEIEKLGRR